MKKEEGEVVLSLDKKIHNNSGRNEIKMTYNGDDLDIPA